MTNRNSWLNRLNKLNMVKDSALAADSVSTCDSTHCGDGIHSAGVPVSGSVCRGVGTLRGGKAGALRGRVGRTLKSQSGMSLVEVMVAFVVLMIVFSIFYRGVNLANNLNRSAVANESRIEAAIEHYYIDSSAAADASTDVAAVASCDGVTAFTLHDSVCVYSTGGYSFYYWKAGGNK